MNLHSLPKYLSAILWTALVTLGLWLFRERLTPANYSLIYLMMVVFIAIFQGTLPSLLASLLTFAAFNFFLVEPLYTLRVADPRELLDLLVFLVVALVTGQLAARVRQQASDARQHSVEQKILYKLASSFNQLTRAEEVYQTLKQVFEGDLGVQQYRVVMNDGALAAGDGTAIYVVLSAANKIYGTLQVAFDKPPKPSQVRFVTTCALQGATALQRIELAEHAQRSQHLEEADRLKTALLHAVSHDLRTPITIIKTSVSNLLNLGTHLPSEERSEMLKAIETEADVLDSMVGNLLDMSRLKAGALQMNLVWNSLEEVAGDVAARVWQLSQQERIRIDFPADFPLVQFDYGLILQVLGNLVENALRYEPPDSKVEIRGQVYAREVRLAVVNHGPNIPIEDREKVMEPFYHGTGGGRTGLGLAIAKGIIEAHRGNIWVEDTAGGGATFVFSLPYASLAKETVNESAGRG